MTWRCSCLGQQCGFRQDRRWPKHLKIRSGGRGEYRGLWKAPVCYCGWIEICTWSGFHTCPGKSWEGPYLSALEFEALTHGKQSVRQSRSFLSTEGRHRSLSTSGWPTGSRPWRTLLPTSSGPGVQRLEWPHATGSQNFTELHQIIAKQKALRKQQTITINLIMKSDFQSYQVLLLKMLIFQPKSETFKETGKYDSYTRRKNISK